MAVENAVSMLDFNLAQPQLDPAQRPSSPTLSISSSSSSSGESSSESSDSSSEGEGEGEGEESESNITPTLEKVHVYMFYGSIYTQYKSKTISVPYAASVHVIHTFTQWWWRLLGVWSLHVKWDR